MSRGAHPWWMGPATALAAAVIGLLARTWRFEVHDDPGYVEGLERGERFAYALWHARMLPLVWHHRNGGHVVLVSRSRDGELITRIIERFGFRTARGSSTRGGEAAIRELLAAAAAGRSIAFTPDGPRGPAEVAKSGLTVVAGQAGLRVAPTAAASPDAWRLRSWDGFRIPKPFARVVIGHGAPLAIAPPGDPGTAERERARAEAALRELTAEVARRAGERA